MKEEWQISNNYFKTMFNLHGDVRNVEEEITHLQSTFHNYFKVQCGTIKSVDPNNEYQEKYSNISKIQLKLIFSNFKTSK